MTDTPDVNAVREIALTEMNGEPRARDLDIAERLGFDRPRDIRKLIDRNRAEIEALGTCATVAHVVRGNPVTEFWLNEEQALLLAILSNAPNAPAVRAMLIKTFVAWRRGHLESALPPETVEMIRRADGVGRANRRELSVVKTQLAELTARLSDVGALIDPAAGRLIDYQPAVRVLDDMKVPSKGRRSLVAKTTARLFAYTATHKLKFRKEYGGRRLFHVDAIAGWLASEGNLLIAEHMAAVSRQGLLKLVPTFSQQGDQKHG